MSNIFKPKRSSTASSVPTTGQLADGELAVNITDKKIFVRDGVSVIEVANFSSPSGISDGDKGDITVSASGATWTIDNGVVSNAKLANVSTSTFKGRITGGTGSPQDLTGTEATTLLNTFTSSLKGLAPASGGGTSNFLRADGTWTAPAGGGGAGIATVREIALTSGTTYTPTAGTTHIMVYCTGGGGGGGNASGTDTSNSSVGAGGGAGGTAIKLYTITELGANATYAIGLGGAGGTTAGATGATGGTTTFFPAGAGADLTTNGGLGGTGNSTAATAVYANGGTGGSATGGDINARGQSGFAVGSVAAAAIGGNGGASFYAGGGEGGYTITNIAVAGSSVVSTPGAGGGGGATRNLNNAGTGGGVGGDGGNGIIFIIEYGT